MSAKYAILLTIGGLELSSYLIHRVVDDLCISMPEVHTFSTLSPVTALVPWLLSVCASSLSYIITFNIYRDIG